MKLTRLTPDDFDRLAAMTKLGDRARAMARAVLVDGRPQADVATEYGMTKQRVNLAVGAVKRAYGKAAALGLTAASPPAFPVSAPDPHPPRHQAWTGAARPTTRPATWLSIRPATA